MPVLVFCLCPSSVRVVATFSGTVLFPLLCQLMMYRAKVAVCSEIRTYYSTQSKHRVEFLNIEPGGT